MRVLGSNGRVYALGEANSLMPMSPLAPITLQEAQAFLQGMLRGEKGHGGNGGEEDKGPRDEVAE